jgi:MFS family permease
VIDAIRYMRATPGLGAIALLTVGVVMVGFPYLTFLPTLADDRFEVGAVGFGVMSGVAGLGALMAGALDARNNRHLRPWLTIAWAGAAFGVAMVVLGFAPSFAVALVALAAVGAAGLVFQTSTQALMLRMSALEYHGRLQSLVILGFSGFGLAALPLGLLADATSLVLIGMGVVVLAMTGVFSWVRWLHRRRPSALDIG